MWTIGWDHHLHLLEHYYFSSSFDSAVRHRRILRLPQLLLVSIMVEHSKYWVKYFKETRRVYFQVMYTFRNDAFREDTVLGPTSIGTIAAAPISAGPISTGSTLAGVVGALAVLGVAGAHQNLMVV